MSYVNTGRQIVGILRQVAVYPDSSRVLTGVTKSNDISDPDYIAPISGAGPLAACPLPMTTTTTTTSTSTTTTSTTTAAPGSMGHFTLGAAYGMTIVSVNGSSTGVPSAFASANVLPATNFVKPIGIVPAQTFAIVVSGTPALPIKLDLLRNGVQVASVNVPAAATYYLTLGTGVSLSTDKLEIYVDSI